VFTTGRERREQSAGFKFSVLQRGLSGAAWEAAFAPRRDCLSVEQQPLVAGDMDVYARNRGLPATTRRGCCSTRLKGVTMATRTIAKTDKWSRETYKQKELSRITSSAPAWAWGCDRCKFGVVTGTTNQLCTCEAGQARGRWASGNMREDADDVHVPTFNAAYGG